MRSFAVTVVLGLGLSFASVVGAEEEARPDDAKAAGQPCDRAVSGNGGRGGSDPIDRGPATSGSWRGFSEGGRGDGGGGRGFSEGGSGGGGRGDSAP